MGIAQADLDRKPQQVELHRFESEDDDFRDCKINVRFPCGKGMVVGFVAPETVVDEDWMRATHRKILEAMITILRDGTVSERPDRQAFKEFQRYERSIVGAVRKLLEDWNEKRVLRARNLAKPVWNQ